MAAAPFIIAGVQTGYQLDQANKLASAQEEAQKIRNAQVVKQTDANYAELSDIERDAQEQSFERSISIQKDYIQKKGRVNVMAAAMGTAGMSMQSQLRGLERDKFSDYDTVLKDRQASMDNFRSRAESMRYSAASSQDIRPISRPSYASAALNIGSASIQGYSAYKESQQQSELLTTGV